MAYDLSGILTGGAASRADSISGLSPEYRAVLEAMMAAAPPDIASELQIMSGYRSPETQARLWNDALKKYGSESAARKWVAPPGRSRHGMGQAIDWSYGSQAARNWVRENATRFGGEFPLAHEPWHMELAGARNGKAPTTGPAAVVPANAGISLNASPAAPSAPLLGTPTPAVGATGLPGGNPLSSIIGAITGGGNSGGQSEATTITPSSISQDTGSAEAAQAAGLMATLMADRRKRYGLSLMG